MPPHPAACLDPTLPTESRRAEAELRAPAAPHRQGVPRAGTRHSARPGGSQSGPPPRRGEHNGPTDSAGRPTAARAQGTPAPMDLAGAGGLCGACGRVAGRLRLGNPEAGPLRPPAHDGCGQAAPGQVAAGLFLVGPGCGSAAGGDAVSDGCAGGHPSPPRLRLLLRGRLRGRLRADCTCGGDRKPGVGRSRQASVGVRVAARPPGTGRRRLALAPRHSAMLILRLLPSPALSVFRARVFACTAG